MDRFLCFLSLVLVSHAALSTPTPVQVYWQKVLPNTPMPSAIRDLIDTDDNTQNSTTSTSTNTDKSTNTNAQVNTGGVHVSTPKGVTVNAGHGGVNVNVGHHDKPPVTVNVSPFYYIYAATATQLHDDPRVTLFFLERHLHPGATMNLNFKTTNSRATFIPSTMANKVPFSSTRFSDILRQFEIDPNSSEAEAMKKTIKECERPGINGESKYCATSLESMVNFTSRVLDTTNLDAISTTIKGHSIAKEKEYTIAKSGIESVRGNKIVVCHLEKYKYAVYYCHAARKTKAYKVKMVSGDGATVVEAVVACHTDTMGWNPKHVAFRVLGVRPGTVPVCHFLPQDHVVWEPRG